MGRASQFLICTILVTWYVGISLQQDWNESLRLEVTSPGRVDQAIEFALPNEQCRQKLGGMYGKGLQLPENVVKEIVSRTSGVSAAFIKELMRRTTQFTLDRSADGDVGMEDVRLALDEMLSSSSALNLKILGYSKGE